MFRLEDNVPACYVEQSRDFQLICRLYNTVINNLIFDAHNITRILDPLNCDEKLLPLISSYVGFFPRVDINTRTLRYILSAFPTIMQNKGSELAIREAVAAILKAENSVGAIYIVNTKRYIPGDAYEDALSYKISIATPIKLTNSNRRALLEVLRYILPAGYLVELNHSNYVPGEYKRVVMSSSEKVYTITSGLGTSAVVRNSDLPSKTGVSKEDIAVVNSVYNVFDTNEVVSNQALKDGKVDAEYTINSTSDPS